MRASWILFAVVVMLFAITVQAGGGKKGSGGGKGSKSRDVNDLIDWIFKRADQNEDSFIDQSEFEEKKRKLGKDLNFADADTNGDDKLDKVELRAAIIARRAAAFDTKNKNDDDHLTKEEIAEHLAAKNRADRVFEMADKNDDNFIDESEFEAEKKKFGKNFVFADADTNDDDKLDKEELSAAIVDRVDRIFGKMDKNDDGYIDQDGEFNGGKIGRRLNFDEADINDDRKLDKAELAAALIDTKAQKVMDRLDENKDGQISQEEHMSNVPQRFRKGKRRGGHG